MAEETTTVQRTGTWLQGQWADASPQRRAITFGIPALVLAGLLYILVVPRIGPQWVPLARGQQPEDAQAAIGALEVKGIEYQLEAGGTILVREDRVHEARLELATTTLGAGHAVGFELFDTSELGRSSFTEKINFKRALEGELARTIRTIQAVDKARVHLVMPERRLFEEDQAETSAAVTLTLRSGAALSRARVDAIRHVVAGSVERLSAEQVSVMDHRGNMLARPSDEDWARAEALESQSRFQRSYERSLEERVVALMEPMVGGADRVKATVSASFDFSRLSETEENFDPDSQVVRSEREQTETSEQVTNVAEGVPGTTSNLPDTASDQTRQGESKPSTSERLDHVKNYEIDRSTLHRETPHPRLTRLSVGVVIDQQAPLSTQDAEPRTWSEAEITAFREVISRAVGIETERGDAIELASVPFASPQPRPEAPAEAPVWYMRRDLFVPWGLGGGIALIVLILLIGLFRRRPAPSFIEGIDGHVLAQGSATGPEMAALQERIASLRERAIQHGDRDIEGTVQVLRNWLSRRRGDGSSEEARA